MTKENSEPYDRASVFILIAEELKRIVSTETGVIYSDPERLSILLRRNLGPKYVREIFLMLAPARANIVRQLLYVSDKRDLDRKLLSAIENIRLQTGCNEADSRRAVYCWAYALDKVTQKEFYQANKLSQIQSNTNGSQEPMKDVSQEPMKDVSQEPMKDVSQEPMKDVSQEPMKDVSQEPMKDVSPPPGKDYPPTDIEEVYRVPKDDISGNYTEEQKQFAIFRKNKVRIPLGIAIAAGIIILIVVGMGQTRNVTADLPVALFTVNSTKVFGGDNVIVDATGSTTSEGKIVKYDWSVVDNNGLAVELPQNVSKLEIPTKPSPSNYIINIQLVVEDDKGSRSEVAEESVSVNAEQIKFNFTPE